MYTAEFSVLLMLMISPRDSTKTKVLHSTSLKVTLKIPSKRLVP